MGIKLNNCVLVWDHLDFIRGRPAGHTLIGNIPPIHQVLLLCRNSPLGLDTPAPEVIITFWSRAKHGFTRRRGVGMLAKGKNLVINCVFLYRRSHSQNWVLLLSGRGRRWLDRLVIIKEVIQKVIQIIQ